MKDYYHVLGVSKGATQAEIRIAYRRRARAVHPDCSDEDGGSFRELQEAYDVLGDPVCRRAYDRKRRRVIRQPHPVSGARVESDRSELLDELRRHFGRHAKAPAEAPPGSEDLKLRVRLSRREVREGGRLEFALSLADACSNCGGTGVRGYSPCPVCRASGVVRRQVPVALSFPPGIREGQQATVPLAVPGRRDVYLQLTFTVAQ